MIDLHSHVIPGIDDGPGTIEESLRLLECAVQNGIDTMVATPHYSCYYTNEKDMILKHFEYLKQAVRAHGLPMNLLSGQEIWIHDTLLERYEAGQLMTLAHSRYMLIEFPPEEIPSYAESLFSELGARGIRPIIAHPERNAAFFKSPDQLYRLLQKGALTQLTSASLLGLFGKRAQAFSHELIQADWIHVIATDAHNIEKRPFHLKEAYEAIALEYGAWQVNHFKENAHAIIEDRLLDARDFKQIDRKKRFGVF